MTTGQQPTNYDSSNGALGFAELTEERRALLKRTAANGTLTDDEFEIYLHACKTHRVDPFSKLIHPVKRKSKVGNEWVEVMALQASIDFFRLTAERSGHYSGQLGPQWCGEDGVWRDVWLDRQPPRAARIGILREDFSEVLWTVALWDNYVQANYQGEPTKFWKAMGPLMLAKCCEALGLRRAFPRDLAGLYTPEEMQQASNREQSREEPRDVTPEPQTLQQPPEPIKAQAAKRDPHPTTIEELTQALPPQPKQQPKKLGPTPRSPFTWKPGPGMPELELAIPAPECGPWESWCDEEIPAGKLHERAKTWRIAAQGKKVGGRAALVQRIVVKAQSPQVEETIHHQRAACTLAMILAGLGHAKSENTEGQLFPQPH